MKQKKILAAMMAAALAVSPATVLASDAGTDPGTSTPTNSELTTPGAGDEITVEGETTYVDTLVYKVTLPTSQGLNFKLDPQGVYSYFASKTDSDPNPTEDDLTPGKIVGDGSHEIMNKSSVPVAVTCDYKLSTTSSNLNIVTDSADVTEDGKEVYLTIVGGKLDTNNKFVADADADAYSSAIGSESSKTVVVLGNADYEFVKDSSSGEDVFKYEPKAAGTGVTTETKAAVSIDGSMSAKGDWSDLSSGGQKLTLSCVYSFSGVKDDSAATKTATGFVTADADKIEYLDNSASNVLTGTYSLASGGSFTIPLNGFTVKTATVVSKPGTATTNSPLTNGDQYKVDGDSFILRTPWVSTRTAGVWVIDLSDGSTTRTLTLTVTA